jgi:segregation and condensation protein A
VLLTTDYRVRLESFEGPLDLLLFLIRRAEVDITDIPVAAIADQYITYLKAIDTIDIELAGEFLVMAATLMEIKSRMLAPAKPGAESIGDAMDAAGAADTTDPRADLVRQLLAYKKFRDASDALDHRRQQWEQRYPAARAGMDDEELREAILASAQDVELEDVSLVDLVDAFSAIIASVNFDRLGDHQVTYDDTPIELHAEDIVEHLKKQTEGAQVPLVGLFTGRTRSEMLGLFLAVLELVRRRSISVQQDADNGSIVIALRPDEPPPDVPIVETIPASRATDSAGPPA